VIRVELNLVGLAMRAERKVIDKIVDGLQFQQLVREPIISERGPHTECLHRCESLIVNSVPLECRTGLRGGPASDNWPDHPPGAPVPRHVAQQNPCLSQRERSATPA